MLKFLAGVLTGIWIMILINAMTAPSDVQLFNRLWDKGVVDTQMEIKHDEIVALYNSLIEDGEEVQ